MPISYHTQKQASLFKLLQKGGEGAADGSPFTPPFKMIIIITGGIVYFMEVPYTWLGASGKTALQGSDASSFILASVFLVFLSVSPLLFKPWWK
ncbi:MAG: hypothetical protein V7K64_22385 [Nostoc sp.]|uniref:hypothetical protein n=1 Tax=Nostoc sp. TaxID=1180 RepID=UPI002FF5395D